MFHELTEDLLDLRVTEKGYGSAMYAAKQDEPGCSNCGLCCSIVLCCCYVCW
jgi:hypothetical protein